jgi:amidase
VRIPASFCGLYGLRATHDRIDASGAMAMAPSFDTVGFFANGPGVLRHVGGVLLDRPSVVAEIATMIVADDCFAQADAPVAALGRAFLDRAAGALPKPQSRTVAPDGFDHWREAFRIVQAFETWQSFGPFVTKAKPSIGPGVKERIAFAATVTAAQADASRKVVAEARAHIRALVPPGTVIALPTAPSIAPRLDLSGDELESFRVRVMRLTCMAGLAGLPQINIPIGTVAGCPAGLSFIAWPGGDEALLDLVCALAKHCGLSS